MNAEPISRYERLPKKETTRRIKVKISSQRLTTGEYILSALLFVMIFAGVFIAVHKSAQIDAVNRNIKDQIASVSSNEEIINNLEYEKIFLSNPERILEIARANGLNIRNTKVKQANQVE